MADALLAMLVCGTAACLLPQDDTYLAGIPERKNRPPRIVESQAEPTRRLVREFGAAGLCELEFAVLVEDPDVDDLIAVRWYFDYDSNNPTGPYREFRLQNNGQALRQRSSLRISQGSASSPLSTPGLHVVEVLVSDTRLVGREPEPISVTPLADGGPPIVNPGYATTYAWVVETVQGDCR